MPADGTTRALAGALLRDACEGRWPAEGPRLVPVDGGAPHAPLRDGLTIGRGRASDVRLERPEISRAHARVVATGDGFAIVDLRSKNGVAVNGRAIASRAAPLRDGDVVALGPVRLRVAGLEPGPPPPAPARRPRRWLAPGAGALAALAAALAALAASVG